jgi:Fic family protein
MANYIHELKDWPHFVWDERALTESLVNVRHRQGRLIGRMEALGFQMRAEANLQTLTEDIQKSSEIEGEFLNKEQVRSSIARRLGMASVAITPTDRNVEGIVEMMLDATQNYLEPLTSRRLFDWHATLFPTGRSGMTRITVGAWRDDQTGPMQVLSGPIGRERVHFQAPAADRLELEMQAFLKWFESSVPLDTVLKAAIAHFWFVTVHPFDDGNGRISRAVADMALARSENSTQRFYSMSAQIRIERTAYYDMLENTQKGDLDITPWITWFLECLNRAFDGAEKILSTVLNKAAFWDRFANSRFNDRQRLMINRLLDGFEGKLTSSKWSIIAKCSQDTALRDIEGLIDSGVLEKDGGGGRSTAYLLRMI